ncbi:hypothetical protein [Streptomyces sp. BE303]|uniref:hypothetical protein n=1 Tax=Streptomyces sp. BE303 TaxID=3002528 RepID=UPI002E75FF7C|nr:hypothetical protein [Streptomyces sp. BE303]MED7951732.1 hypothetical protein [Streptomyces sp. BE303]
MRDRFRTGRPRVRSAHLAGWLFADLLLVLALVAMGDQGDPVAAARATATPAATATATATATADASATASETPRPTPTPTGPRGVEHDAVTVDVTGDSSDTAGLVAQIRAATERYAGRQAAVVLTFGSNRDPGAGQAYAHTVNGLLAQARPEMFRGTTTRDFISLTDNPRHASLEIYFYTG